MQQITKVTESIYIPATRSIWLWCTRLRAETRPHTRRQWRSISTKQRRKQSERIWKMLLKTRPGMDGSPNGSEWKTGTRRDETRRGGITEDVGGCCMEEWEDANVRWTRKGRHTHTHTHTDTDTKRHRHRILFTSATTECFVVVIGTPAISIQLSVSFDCLDAWISVRRHPRIIAVRPPIQQLLLPLLRCRPSSVDVTRDHREVFDGEPRGWPTTDEPAYCVACGLCRAHFNGVWLDDRPVGHHSSRSAASEGGRERGDTSTSYNEASSCGVKRPDVRWTLYVEQWFRRQVLWRAGSLN